MNNKKIQLIVGAIAVLVISALFSLQGKLNQIKSGVAEKSSINQIQEVYASLPEQAKPFYYQQSEELTKPVPERLVELDQKTIGCFRTDAITQMSSTDNNLGGQCCGVLKNIETYEEQLPVLLHFIEDNGDIELIPKDPYDIPVAHSQTLIAFDKNIILTLEQQGTYAKAVTLSHHGGPCCCKCWKWYMMSGLGKKLIVDYGFNAEQLAELWDLSSSCGHDEDIDMHEHYQEESEDDSHSH